MFGVMAGLVPAIHAFIGCEVVKTWMPANKRGHDGGAGGKSARSERAFRLLRPTTLRNDLERLLRLSNVSRKGNLRRPVTLNERGFVKAQVFDDDLIAFDVQLVERARAGISCRDPGAVNFEPVEIIANVSWKPGVAHDNDARFFIHNLRTIFRVRCPRQYIVDRALKQAIFLRRPNLQRNHPENEYDCSGQNGCHMSRPYTPPYYTISPGLFSYPL
jgi:hypothetical protein